MVDEQKCNQSIFNNDNGNSNDSDSDSDFVFDRFENAKKNDSKYLSISLDMSAFPKYLKAYTKLV